MKKILLLTSILLSQICYGDDPDFSKEEKLHKIFERYNENPTPETSWQTALGQSKTPSYKVQQGDTLWNLSETLFADPTFWPKLWSVNNPNGLENPHEIVPGQLVVFTPGTEASAPKVSVQKDASAIPDPDAATLQSEQELLVKSKLPDPKRKTSEAIDLPDSLPNWSFNRKAPGIDQIDFLPRMTYPSNKKEIIPQLITEDHPQGVGEVSETELGMRSAGELQYIYVTLATEGKNFFIIKEVGTVTDPVTEKKAIVSQIQGEIEIVGKVEKNLYRAIVVRCVNPVEVGATLMKDSAPRYDTSISDLKQTGASVQGQIISGEVGYQNHMASTSSFMYFNFGKDKTVSVGQVLPIYKKNISLYSSTVVDENRLKIGQVVIVQVTDHFSVGMISNSSEEIKVGDLTY